MPDSKKIEEIIEQIFIYFLSVTMMMSHKPDERFTKSDNLFVFVL